MAQICDMQMLTIHIHTYRCVCVCVCAFVRLPVCAQLRTNCKQFKFVSNSHQLHLKSDAQMRLFSQF